MWRIHDATRMNRRHIHVQLANSIYKSQLALERRPELRPVFDLSKYNALGGHTGRALLVSWIFEETAVSHLTLSTACLTVSLLERVLSKRRVSLHHAQSIAACCLLIAMKLEETGGDAMEIPESVQVHVDVWMEIRIGKALQWNIITPTIHTFLCIFAKRVWLPPGCRARAERYLKSVLLRKFWTINLLLSSCVFLRVCCTSLYSQHEIGLFCHYTDCDSQLFSPSSLALICILFVERDGLLPDVCKQLTLKAVRESKSRAEEVAHAFRIFRQKCPSPLEAIAACNAGKLANEDDEYGVDSSVSRWDVRTTSSSCDSSTTAYPGSRSTTSSSACERYLAS